MSSLVRRLTHGDLPRITALLEAHIETSMFPLTNLRDAGLDTDAIHGMTGWCRPDLTGVVFVTNGGMVQPQWPGGTRREWRAITQAMSGRALSGVIGDPDQGAAFLDAAGLSSVPTSITGREAGYSLDLQTLRIPKTHGATLAPLAEAHRDTVTAWLAAYQIETLGASPDKANERAVSDFDRYLNRGRHRVLSKADEPRAMTAFNAVYEHVVQIGPVYTPPEFRNRGFARIAVALHLLEAQAQGTKRALLFTSNPAAARAYQALGFSQYGAFGLTLFVEPQEISLV